MRLWSLVRPGLIWSIFWIPYLFGWELSSLYTCNTILHSVHYIIHYSAISKNDSVDYQSISQHDIIYTGINCTMIRYNSLSECLVSSWNTSHLIPFQHRFELTGAENNKNFSCIFGDCQNFGCFQYAVMHQQMLDADCCVVGPSEAVDFNQKWQVHVHLELKSMSYNVGCIRIHIAMWWHTQPVAPNNKMIK